MNKWIGIGNLANDPELRTTTTGKSVCTFRLAVQRRFTNAQGVREADFFTVVAWGKQGETIAQYCAKGRKLAVVGEIQTRTYDAQDGSKRYVTEVNLQEFEFLGSSENRSSGGGGASASAAAAAAMGSDSGSMAAQGFTEVDDDELPFEQIG